MRYNFIGVQVFSSFFSRLSFPISKETAVTQKPVLDKTVQPRYRMRYDHKRGSRIWSLFGATQENNYTSRSAGACVESDGIPDWKFSGSQASSNALAVENESLNIINRKQACFDIPVNMKRAFWNLAKSLLEPCKSRDDVHVC